MFLKVVSILMIIFGIIFGIFSVLGLAGAFFSIYLLIPALIGIAANAIEIIGGFKGLAAVNDPSKAGTCVTIGIVLIVLAVISHAPGIISVVTAMGFASAFGASPGRAAAGVGMLTFASLAISLVIPILYIVAAKQVKKAAA